MFFMLKIFPWRTLREPLSCVRRSAGISDHLSCDLGKGTLSEKQPPIKVMSLSANGPILTAIANDYGYDQIFATQVEMYGERGDILITISSSGNSPNIVNASLFAKEKDAETVAMVGFDGGECSRIAENKIHVPTAKRKYGVVEGLHEAIHHYLYEFARKLEGL
jgi:phosphoheptose isomerase